MYASGRYVWTPVLLPPHTPVDTRDLHTPAASSASKLEPTPRRLLGSLGVPPDEGYEFAERLGRFPHANVRPLLRCMQTTRI